jgi:hypothetical protein
MVENGNVFEGYVSVSEVRMVKRIYKKKNRKMNLSYLNIRDD